MEQTKLITKNIGNINPVSSADYAAAGGYAAIKKALSDPDIIIGTLKEAGLLGRGGAGFPVWLKWNMVKEAQADQKYIICNADEGEPGTAKDRIILSGNPHLVIEGMLIAGLAVGADKGYLYIRAEYPYVRKIVEAALADARQFGCLGENLLNTAFHFDIEIRSGKGAYICGEETALIESVEGKRGEPRMKPPYPGIAGLLGKPTVINNVETLASVPQILTDGAASFRKNGTAKCPGTKLITLSGAVKNPGVYEFPIGISIHQLFEEAGGCPNGKNLKGFQCGGGSGPIVRADLLDTFFDPEGCAAVGASFGTGDLMFFDEDISVVDLCQNIMEFFVDESCGECVPCRIGTARMLDLLTHFAKGKGSMDDLKMLEELASHVKAAARCGFGSAAPVAVLSALKDFRSEFETMIADNKRK